MPIGQRKLVVVIAGDALHVFAVRTSGGMARVVASGVVEAFLGTSVEAARETMQRVDRGGALVVVCPAKWCASRPIDLDPSKWTASVDQLRSSIDQLVPMSSDDADLGMVAMRSERGEGLRSSLVAVRSSTLSKWLDPIELAAGREASEVISPQMAVVGLGLGGPESRRVSCAIGGDGNGFVATLKDGVPIAFAPDLGHVGADVSLRNPSDLAAPAAAIGTVAMGLYHPIRGRSVSVGRRLVAPALVAVASIVLAFASGALFEQRAKAALEDVRTQIRSIDGEVADAQDLRLRAEAKLDLVRDAVIAPTESWRSVVPVLLDVQNALGTDGQAHRIDVTSERLSIRGEATEASAVLDAIEKSGWLANARFTQPISSQGIDRRVIFEIAADRVAPPAGEGVTP